MRLNSNYRLFVLDAVAYFNVVSVEKSSLSVMIKAIPGLENEDKFIRACQKLQMKGLVKFLNLFEETGRKMDAVSITTAGLKYLNTTNMPLHSLRKYRLQKGRNFDTKILSLKQNQLEIFANCQTRLNEHDCRFLSRDDLIQYLIKIDEWTRYLQFKAARVTGCLLTTKNFIPIYNVFDKNIIVNPKSEMGFYKGILEATGLSSSPRTILFSPSEAVFNKTIMAKSIPFDRKKPSSLGKQSIYSINDYNKSRSQYVLLNSIEQAALLPLFSVEDTEKLFSDVILISENKKTTIDSAFVSGCDILPAVIFETDEEVGVQIILQNMYTLRSLFEICMARQEGKSSDNRKIIIYGLSANRNVYNYIFKAFSFTEFKWVETEEFYKIIDGGEDDE